MHQDQMFFPPLELIPDAVFFPQQPQRVYLQDTPTLLCMYYPVTSMSGNNEIRALNE